MMLMPGGTSSWENRTRSSLRSSPSTRRDTPRRRVVRHQNDVTARKADERGQRRTLVAAFVLVDLDDDLLAFAQRFPDADPAGSAWDSGKTTADFLERKNPWRSLP